ncbi:hypothetical protein M405DRAFT_838453 [Rhizopogon salebrosus TDB-379]|nr:hypothetical protein M405DRAFT_838453 [Rhizopogon salebrosus TDB-379]
MPPECSPAHFMQNMKSLGEYVQKATGSLPKLVLVILPISSADVCLAVKQFGDVHVGVPTQIDAKLGGVNALSRFHALEKLMSVLFEAMMLIPHPRQEQIDELRKLVYQAIDEFSNRNNLRHRRSWRLSRTVLDSGVAAELEASG